MSAACSVVRGDGTTRSPFLLTSRSTSQKALHSVLVFKANKRSPGIEQSWVASAQVIQTNRIVRVIVVAPDQEAFLIELLVALLLQNGRDVEKFFGSLVPLRRRSFLEVLAT